MKFQTEEIPIAKYEGITDEIIYKDLISKMIQEIPFEYLEKIFKCSKREPEPFNKQRDTFEELRAKSLGYEFYKVELEVNFKFK